jgi:hypothetical protein
MDARHFVDGQLMLLVGVALGEPVEAIMEADGPLESIWFSRFMRSLTIEGWFLFTFRQFCG